MAFFGVTKEKINSVKHHPNADCLDICTLEGMSFQFVTERDKHHVGETVLYFPVDSVFPFSLMKKMGLVKEKKENGEIVLDENGNPIIEGILSGRKKNRLKTVSIRGEISQGIVGSLNLLNDSEKHLETTEDITNYLGITKYEYIPHNEKPSYLRPLPVELSKYDIELAQRHEDILQQMMNLRVCITEKLEGTNFSITYRPGSNEFFVNQRSDTIIPNKQGKNHPFWKWVNKTNILEEIKSKDFNCNSITFYGEFVGPKIQKNIYSFPDNRVYFYDIFIDDRFLNVRDKYNMFAKIPCIKHVPLLFYDKVLSDILKNRSIVDFSNGESFFCCKSLREGIVITPMEEKQIIGFGRLILKQRSLRYLLKTNN